MIIDSINNAHYYMNLHPDFPLLVSALNEIDSLPAFTEPQSIGWNESYFMVQSYTPASSANRLWETHRRFIDVQIILSGSERIGWSPSNMLTIVEPYDAEKDIEVLDGEGLMHSLGPGDFVILFPTDAHMPGIINGKRRNNVTKIVSKLSMEAMNRS